MVEYVISNNSVSHVQEDFFKCTKGSLLVLKPKGLIIPIKRAPFY